MPDPLRSRQFWGLADQAAQRPHDETLLNALADHVGDVDHADSVRAHVIRTGNPLRAIPHRGAKAGYGLPSIAGLERIEAAGGDPAAPQHFVQGDDPTRVAEHQVVLRGETVPRTLHGVYQGWASVDNGGAAETPMATVNDGPERYEIFRALLPYDARVNGPRHEHEGVPVVRYTLALPGRKRLRLVAPVHAGHMAELVHKARVRGDTAAAKAVDDVMRRFTGKYGHPVTRLARKVGRVAKIKPEDAAKGHLDLPEQDDGVIGAAAQVGRVPQHNITDGTAGLALADAMLARGHAVAGLPESDPEHPVRLARMRAPGGGMVQGDNTYAPGGRFVTKAFKRIRSVAEKLMKLSRPLTGPEDAKLTGSPVKAESVVKPFTIRDLNGLEDSLQMAKDKRLSRHVTPNEPEKGLDSTFTAANHHIAAFLDNAYKNRRRYSGLKKALTDPTLSDEQKVVHAALHLKHEAGEFVRASGAHSGADWYGSHVDALELALQHAHGIRPGSPEATLAKHFIAATSGNTEPRDNAFIFHRMLNEGRRNNPKNPFLGIPSYNEKALRDWLARPAHDTDKDGKPLPKPKDRNVLATPGRTAVGPSTPPAAELAWYKDHVLPNRKLLDGASGDADVRSGYKGRPAVIVDAPKHEDHGKLVEYQHDGKEILAPDGGALYQRHRGKGRLRKINLPIPDEHGRLQPKGWNSRGEQVEQGVERLKKLIELKGNKGAADWLLAEHPDAEFQTLFGMTPKHEQVGESGDLPGSFILGPKFGAFAQNLHANAADGAKYAQWLTADKWWSRTWNRFLGTLVIDKKTHQESPRGPAERQLMVEAAKRAVKMAGLGNVAELQAVLWYYEQALWRTLGARARSSSFLDGANAILRDAFPGEPPYAVVEKGKARLLQAGKPVKLARTAGDGAGPGVVPLWVLDRLAAKLAAEGRIPSPYLLVQALLAAAGQGGGPVRLSRPAEPLTPEHVVYVSPSDRDGGGFEQAIHGFHSPAMVEQAKAAMQLPTVRQVKPGYGFWRDGAEESNTVHVGDPQFLARVGAVLGRQFRQKAVLTFHETPDGTDARHVIVVPETDPRKIHDDMMRHGIEYKTMIPLPGGQTRIEAVDAGDAMRPEFGGYAREAGAVSHQVRAGRAVFIGADDREAAAREFDKILAPPPA